MNTFERTSMWREIGQILFRYYQELVKKNKLGKIEAIHEDINMSIDIIHNKLSSNPRCALRMGEFWSLLNEMKRRDKETYQSFCRTLMNDNDICVK